MTSPSGPSTPDGQDGAPRAARAQEAVRRPDLHPASNEPRRAPAGPGARSDQPAGAHADGGADGQSLNPGDEAPPGQAGTGENVCPQCGGSGRAGAAACPTCSGSGKVVSIVGGA
ncbi:hypothetical protein [Xylophilus sp.]|uniref:hypothetical protein n=1 Tax=Xylophilus sp. TaxID=2653893 RepID=UPI0013B8BAF1|nr:hypothetical protein [Xylophilus sp.]KAF1050230.1 MAG: hypothetical protein GAK38_00256 [Xylophilus sp.]